MHTTGYIAVIGASNADIIGGSSNPLVAEDSNPGRITVCPGRVRRNIAENLAALDVDLKLISAIGDDDTRGNKKQA